MNNMLKITFKKVEADDAPVLLELSRGVFFDAFYHQNKPEDMETYAARNFTPERIQQELVTSGSHFYFVYADDQLAGYLKLNYGSAQSDLHEEDSMEVERIYVSADFQGQGIGQQLLVFALQKACKDKMQSVWLGVWEHNYGAIRFYERYGFVRFGSHNFMLGTDEQTDVLMRCAL